MENVGGDFCGIFPIHFFTLLLLLPPRDITGQTKEGESRRIKIKEALG